jgi:hypothetical protein
MKNKMKIFQIIIIIIIIIIMKKKCNFISKTTFSKENMERT